MLYVDCDAVLSYNFTARSSFSGAITAKSDIRKIRMMKKIDNEAMFLFILMFVAIISSIQLIKFDYQGLIRSNKDLIIIWSFLCGVC